MKKPIISPAQAAKLVKNNWTLTTGGFGSCGHPEALTKAIEKRFLSTGLPRNLHLVFAAGQGDKNTRGLNQLAHAGLLKKVIGGYWALTPKLGEIAKQENIEAYNWPQGIISHLYRAIASGKPGVISSIGLHTFIDPRYGGGKLNKNTHDNLVELIMLQGKEQLFYPAFPINCAFLRGSVADTNGNISMFAEANFHDNLIQAQAVKNSGGIVFVQVLNVVKKNTLPAHEVKIPGALVDYLVVADEKDHWQTYGEKFNPSFTGTIQTKNKTLTIPSPLTIKKIIARRAYLETLKYKNAIINLGIGTPEYLSHVALEENKTNFTLTVESGAFGGYPAGGLSFGASISPQAILEQSTQFDFYDGGGIDIAFLGFGEVDSNGNVNVGKLGEKINGVGGFINISQTSKKLVFCGAFTAGGLEIASGDGKLIILKEGSIKKFTKKVQELDFNAHYSAKNKKQIMYITERAVFELINGSMTLTEFAPGIDIKKDILNRADFEIIVSNSVKEMDTAIFRNKKMLAKKVLLSQ